MTWKRQPYHRVGPCAGTSPTTCFPGAPGWGPGAASLRQQRGLHGRPGGGGDPGPTAARFHAALRRGGRRRDAGPQRGAGGCGWAGAISAPLAYVDVTDVVPTLGTRSTAWTCPQGASGLPPSLVLAGHHGRGALHSPAGQRRELTTARRSGSARPGLDPAPPSNGCACRGHGLLADGNFAAGASMRPSSSATTPNRDGPGQGAGGGEGAWSASRGVPDAQDAEQAT